MVMPLSLRQVTRQLVALLRRVREDSELKKLGENVMRIKCTEEEDMIFELTKIRRVQPTGCSSMWF